MAFALDEYTASPSQTDFTITFSYRDEADVLVYEDGVLKTQGASNDYTFFNSTTIRFNSGLTGGELIIIQRSTSQSTRLTDYTAGALTEADLDNDSLQGFRMAQESIDIANRALGRTADGANFDAETKQIKNVVDPTAAQDASTKAYTDAVGTQVSADAAAAAASAAAASTSETNAATSETNAATSETNAATSESNASTSETNAATSETNAALSEAVLMPNFTFDTSTTMADPGTGDIRWNNATPASVTAIAISASSADTGNPDISAWIADLNSVSATDKADLLIRDKTALGQFHHFTIQSITDNTTWLQLSVTPVVTGTLPGSTDRLACGFVRAGSDGTMNGPVSSTDNSVVLWDGTSGALVKDGPALGTSGDPLLSAGAGSPPAFGKMGVSALANGTDGELITWDAAGAPATVGAGSSGQVLTSNGAGAAPTFQTLSSAGRLIGVQTFTAGGTYTPTAGTNSVVVWLVGGGGGGGSGNNSCCGDAAGGGGGGGGAVMERLTSGFSGQTVTIGAGGAGATVDSSAGTGGGTTSFGALCTATGGAGGNGAASPSGGYGGLAGAGTGGTLNWSGADGGSGSGSSASAGPHGGTAGGPFGGGGGAGARSEANSGGFGGNNYGGGGGGGNGFTGTTGRDGGNGADGVCVVFEYS